MHILIDADGCPVTRIAVRLAKQHGIDCMIICDTAHRIESDGAEIINSFCAVCSAMFSLAAASGSEMLLFSIVCSISSTIVFPRSSSVQKQTQAIIESSAFYYIRKSHI